MDDECCSEVQSLRLAEEQQQTLQDEHCRQVLAQKTSLEVTEDRLITEIALKSELREQLEEQRTMFDLQESTFDEQAYACQVAGVDGMSTGLARVAA